MAQHDYDIINAPGAGVRADINLVLLAIASQNSGISAPSPAFAFMMWADTSSNTLWMRNSGNSAWINMGSLLGFETRLAAAVTANHTASQAEVDAGTITDKFLNPLTHDSAVIHAGRLLAVNIYTFTTATWFKPAGCTHAEVICIGAGGAGGGTVSGTAAMAGGGGAGGGYAYSYLDVSAIASAAVVVGVGQLGSAGANGTSGDSSSFTASGISVIGAGGYGGGVGDGSIAAGTYRDAFGGAVNISGVGQLEIYGQKGSVGEVSTIISPGKGGGSFYSVREVTEYLNNTSNTFSSDGTAGVGPGGGGSGAHKRNVVGAGIGGSAKTGIVIVRSYS